ncbi:MAG: FAD-dependent oxidoreductase [Rhodospirillaceae bacterium]|jgi:2,4-dienoyl-CoA reductase-like NADH-dependent reductase (Old Yellow Enzyme family)/thioredoxin reductase|nr:FAD-dependent oxidoreductase [Rhodospirillaceae bacterium]
MSTEHADGQTLYPNLLGPTTLGGRPVKNRVWMTAHATMLVKDHLFTDEHVNYYVERAKGGVGVITMEAMAVHRSTQPYRGKVFAFEERLVPEYQKIAAAVQAEGTLLMAQPWHRGRQTNSITSSMPVWAPSAVPCGVYREIPHVMTAADIDEIIEGYRISARLAAQGNLDGVEVHGMGHGYLLNQFLSPATNHRNDGFGGSLANRLRIIHEILDATRDEVGKDCIVGVRINSDDGHEGGLGPDEWADIARELEATGHLDYISATHGTYINRMLIYPTSPQEHGFQLAATRKIKEAVSIPVVGVGRILHPSEAEGYLEQGDCDFIGMARALIADPMWVKKAESRRADKIRPCVGANWCMSALAAQVPLACIHNPAAGAELTLGSDTLQSAATARKVAVVGGGPAGMRTALTATRRGHAVTVFERSKTLGGQIGWWTKASSASEIAGISTWLEDRLVESDAKILRNTEATVETLTEGGFDAVILATGGTALRHGWSPLHPEMWGPGTPVDGTDQDHVLTYQQVLADEASVGDNVLIIDTLGGRQAAVTAEYLAERGHAVEFVTQLGQPSPDLAASRDWGKVHGRLRRLGVRFTVDTELVGIEGSTVSLYDLYTSELQDRTGIDTVVLVVGANAEDGLLAPLQERGIEVHIIGDALAPRRVNDAIREGELIARQI